MSSVPSVFPPYRLSFILPDALAAFVREGVHQPCIAGCLLTITRNALVTIDGNARQRVFDQAARFFRLVAKDRPAFIVSARLVVNDPEEIYPKAQRRNEAWEIAVNSQVTFTRDIAPVIASEIETIGNPHG